MFIAAMFVVAKTRKQLKCPLIDELNKENVLHIYNGILLSCKKKMKYCYLQQHKGTLRISC